MREELTEPNLPDPGPPPPPSFPAGDTQEPGFSPAPMPDPFARTFPTEDGLNDRAHTFEHGYYVSWDRTSWWNGSTWVLGSPPGSDQPSQGIDGDAETSPLQIVIAIGGLILFGAVAFSMCQSMPGTGTLTP